MYATQQDPQESAPSATRARRLILHAGMQKTGSTSIQHFLDAATLRDARYFKGPKPNHSLLFMLLFGDNPESHRTHRLHGQGREETLHLRDAQMAEIAAELDASDINTYVFSGERISKSTRDELGRSLAFFSRWFSQIDVYAYIRSPVNFAASMFQQHLKYGTLPTILNILAGYRHRVENMDAVFGRDNVHLKAFDAEGARIPDIVPDFLTWAGFDAMGNAQGPRNLSLSAEATALLYAIRFRLNRSLNSPAEVQLWNALVRRAQDIGDQKYSFGPDIFGKRRAEVLEDHAWTEERLGQRFPDPLAADTAQLRFSSLEEIRKLGLQIFKTRTGKRLGKLNEGGPLQLKRVVKLLGPPYS
ncbi:hypothetical protein [Loktanella salsilacus]|uniref:hypothetical protein n=1 Tax=Loktanella salsilacus TaxID=195913 RepID=UPI003001BB35